MSVEASSSAKSQREPSQSSSQEQGLKSGDHLLLPECPALVKILEEQTARLVRVEALLGEVKQRLNSYEEVVLQPAIRPGGDITVPEATGLAGRSAPGLLETDLASRR